MIERYGDNYSQQSNKIELNFIEEYKHIQDTKMSPATKPQYIKDIEEIGIMHSLEYVVYQKQDELYRYYNWNEEEEMFMDIDVSLFEEWDNNEGGFNYHCSNVEEMFVTLDRGYKIIKWLINDRLYDH